MSDTVTLPAWVWLVLAIAFIALIVFILRDNWRLERKYREFEASRKAFWERDQERWAALTRELLISANANHLEDEREGECVLCVHDTYEYDPADEAWHSPHNTNPPEPPL